jgi:hypothetical protein
MAANPQSSESDLNIEAYNQQRTTLEAEHLGEYVAIADGRIVGTYPSFDEACQVVEHHKTKLVFQIGDKPVLKPLYISWGKNWHQDG